MKHSQNQHYRRRRHQPSSAAGVEQFSTFDNDRPTISTTLRPRASPSKRNRTVISTTKVVLGFAILNGSLLFMFAWLWYSGVLILPHTSKNSLLASSDKVERRWRKEHKRESPILVVGLPKAGTSSLFEFFHCHGVYSQHWYCCGPQDRADQPGSGGPIHGPSYMSHCLLENLESGSSSILDGCGDYDAYTELNGPHLIPADSKSTKRQQKQQKLPDGIFLPQVYHMQELYDAAPTATWILNLRPVDDWVRSVMNIPAHRLLEQFQQEVAKHNVTAATTTTTSALLRGRRERDVQFLKDFYQSHVDRIQKFASEHRQMTLITVNITDPTAGETLALDLGWLSNSMQYSNLQMNRSAMPISSSLSKARACWKRYNAGEYID